MTTIEAIRAIRDFGVVRGGVLLGERLQPKDVARHFGLRTEEDTYLPISRDRALDILANVVHRDLTHGNEFTSRRCAEELAQGFLAEFPESESDFYTNGTLGWTDEPPLPGRWWMGATSATFDTGVFAISQLQAACCWIADED
jgi:hypothetical protein